MQNAKCKSMTLLERKEKVLELIALFKNGIKFHQSAAFNEAQTRREFIDPFLKCLGWDIDNEKGAHPNRREVIVEDRQNQGGFVKHPDYALRIGGQNAFFVEAKQPSVNLKNNAEPALQARRYAYTAKMNISVLTDFEELCIYDGRIKPSAKDAASVARIRYYNFEEYAEKFEEIYNLIGFDAVDRGSLEAFAEAEGGVRGTASVDDDILKMIEGWRLDLAEDIALHNKEMDEEALTACVQKIIDRIIFLRICEDKEIEEYERLKRTLEEKDGMSFRAEPRSRSGAAARDMTHSGESSQSSIYFRLQRLFLVANEKFNAGLFAPDIFLDGLSIQDKTLKKIIADLYYPACQYEFSILPVEILGSIYERFLGKTIRFRRRTVGGHSIFAEEKAEVKKAGGVFYTPDYIVRYIVEKTIGQKIKGKTPAEVSAMRFLDPACGSGSFLVGAFQYLLDWHLDFYEESENLAAAENEGVIYKDFRTHEYKLSVPEKKRILLNNIFGVDIDAQAVEVTRLSLFLKLLENEGKALRGNIADLFKESDMAQCKILPDMRGNIRCGNSLIGTDYFAECLDLDMAEQRKINAFDWEFEAVCDERRARDAEGAKRSDALRRNEAQAEPAAARPRESGGAPKKTFPLFDCVIGNPPYVSAPNQIELFPEQRQGIIKSGRFRSLYQKWDLYVPFLELALQRLKDEGIASMIVPFPLTNQLYAKVLRKMILSEYDLTEIADLSGVKVFSKATVTNCIPTIRKSHREGFVQISRLREEGEIRPDYSKAHADLVLDGEAQVWDLGMQKRNAARHKDFLVLGDYCYISVGMVLNADEKTAKGEFKKEDLISETQDKIHCRKYIEAKDIGRYEIKRIRYLEYGTKRVPGKLRRPTFPELYERDKLIFNRLGELQVMLDEKNHFLQSDSSFMGILWHDLAGVQNNSISTSVKKFSRHPRQKMEELSKTVSLKFLLAVMNSKCAASLLSEIRGGDYHIYPEHIRNIPIPPATAEQQKKLCVIADGIMGAKAALAKNVPPREREMLLQKVAILERNADKMVEELYG